MLILMLLPLTVLTVLINVTHVNILGNYVPFRSRNVPTRPLRAVQTILELFPPLNVQLPPPLLILIP